MRLWDWPVRLTHWGFVLLIPALWWTAENGEMAWHMRLGQALLVLVVFRIIWGFVGSTPARFANFLKGPRETLAYMIGAKQPIAPPPGHNPIGGWATLLMLLAMLAQASMGLFAGDPYDGATGPLNEWVGVLTADRLTEWHETFFWVLIGLIVAHIIAILLYRLIGKQNLTGPMATGQRAFLSMRKPFKFRSDWFAVLMLLVSAGLVLSITTGLVWGE